MTTDLARFYLKKGMIISNISVAIEYPKYRPLEKFVNFITEKRKEATVAKDDVLQNTYKLLANASWGRLGINRTKYVTRNIRKRITQKIYKSPFFKYAEHVGSEFPTEYVEIVRKPTKIKEISPCKFH